MRKSNKFAVVLLLTGILLVGCRPEDGAITPTTTPVEIPTLLPSVTMPIPSLTPTIKSAQPCEKLVNSETDNSQIAYHGITPGVTTSDELEEIMGEPEEIERFPDIATGMKLQGWHYDNVRIIINAVGIVKNIEVSYLGFEISDKPRLLDIVQTYGCPDVIYALDTAQHPHGYYSVIDLIYLNGLQATFFSNPINLIQDVDQLLFVRSMTFEELIDNYKIYQNPQSAKEIIWENAVEAP